LTIVTDRELWSAEMAYANNNLIAPYGCYGEISRSPLSLRKRQI